MFERPLFERRLADLSEGFDGVLGYVVKNLRTGECFRQSEDRSFDPASTIKLPILCAAYNEAREENTSLDSTIEMRQQDKVGGSGVFTHLGAGPKVSVRDAMTLMIIVSDNTATNMLIDHLSLERINLFIKRCGWRAAVVGRKLFHMEARARGLENSISPYDLAALLEGLARKTPLHPADCLDAVSILAKQQVSNKMPRKLRGRFASSSDPVRFAHKTGEIYGSEHDAGIMYIGEDQVVAVFMTTGLKDNFAGVNIISDLAAMFAGYFRGCAV